MKLIDYPLCHIHSPIFCETNDSFRVISDIDSKIVHTTAISRSKTYILLHITSDDSVNILGSTNTIHTYNIVDFFVPPSPEATYYFTNFYNKLINYDDYNIQASAESESELNTNTVSLEGMNLFYPPPDISLIKPYKSLPSVNLQKKDLYLRDQMIRFDWNNANVPQKPNECYAKEMCTSDVYTQAIAFLNNLFAKKPIVCKAELEQKRGEIESLGMTTTCILKHLPLLAYYTDYGPWLRCWIRFGYDPRGDYKNYVHQRLSKFRIKQHFLYEDRELLDVIERNEDKFVKKWWDKEYGFFKKSLLRFLKRRERGKNIENFVGNK